MRPTCVYAATNLLLLRADALKGLQQPLLAAHVRLSVPASWPQVAENTGVEAQAKWAALWAAIGRSDTALIFHMSDHYSLVHAARQYTLDLGMPKGLCLLASL